MSEHNIDQINLKQEKLINKRIIIFSTDDLKFSFLLKIFNNTIVEMNFHSHYLRQNVAYFGGIFKDSNEQL